MGWRSAGWREGAVVLAALGCGVACVEVGAVVIVPVLALGLGLVCLHRPDWAVLGAYAGILLDSRGLSSVRVAGLPITLAKLLVATALGVHLVHAVLGRRALLPWTPLTAGVLAVLGSMLVSLGSVGDLRLAWIELAGVLMLAALLHLVVAVVELRRLSGLLRWMAAITLLVFLQVLVSARQQGAFAAAQDAWQTRETGAYTDPNAWATALLVSSCFLLGALARDPHRFATPLLLGLLVLFPACLVQSMSRAGLIALVVVSPVLAWSLWPRRRLVAAALVPLLLVTPWVVNVEAALLRYSTLVDPSFEAGIGGSSLREREALVRAAMEVIRLHPVMGVGVGNFRLVAEELTSGAVWKIAHNSYLTIVAEQGVLGVVSHGWLALAALRAAMTAAWRAPTVGLRGVGAGYLSATLAFAAMAATLNLATFALAWFYFGVGLVVTGSVTAASPPSTDQRSITVRSPAARRPGLHHGQNPRRSAAWNWSRS